ncbi:ribonuclease H [Nitzschia inconspicua]|uniref:Ribonuclease H n=1 Tax=Nitzschia inconspicua TaxID=303405 RepID=A0A9K3L284_9STRA|nr:ribonuclease H [Nitzschia inconspicua]
MVPSSNSLTKLRDGPEAGMALYRKLVQRPGSLLALGMKRPWGSDLLLHPIPSSRRRIRPHPLPHQATLTVMIASFSSLSSYADEMASRRLTALFDDPTMFSSHHLTNGRVCKSPISMPILDPTRCYALQTKGVTTRQSRGAGIGLVLYDPISKFKLWSSRIYVYGYRNSLEAEYSALIMGMDYASQVFGVRRLLVESSYHPIVHQITGRYDTRKPSLRTLLNKVRDAQLQFDDCAFHFIKSLPDMRNVETLAYRALASRKCSNIVESIGWQIHERDPMVEKSVLLCSRNNYNNPTMLPPDPPASHLVQIDPSQTYKLQFDGGSRRKFGVAGAGMVIYDTLGDDDGSVEHEIWSGWYFHDEIATNNIAEYLGLLYGLQCALSMDIRKLVVEGDSLLVVRQMNEGYLTKEKSLTILRDRARQVADAFEDCEIRHIPRNLNRRADWLAKYAMDKCESYGFLFLDGRKDSTGWSQSGSLANTTLHSSVRPGYAPSDVSRANKLRRGKTEKEKST